MLQSEGFNFNGLVDIFDGGPTMEAFLHNIRTISQSFVRRVVESDGPVPDENDTAPLLMVCNRNFDEFRVGLVPATELHKAGLRLSKQAMAALQVREGDEVRVAPLKDKPF
jgi:arginine N-succinyltransferase